MEYVKSQNKIIKSSFFFHWDWVVWAVTLFCLAFLIGSPVYMLMVVLPPEKWCNWESVLAVVLPLLIMMGVTLFVPLQLVVNNKQIKLFRLVGSITIPLSEITEIQLVTTPDFLDNMMRAFGCGGFMGYYGWFRHNILGYIKMYATHRQQMFIVKRNGKEYYLFSSHKREEIVHFISENMHT